MRTAVRVDKDQGGGKHWEAMAAIPYVMLTDSNAIDGHGHPIHFSYTFHPWQSFTRDDLKSMVSAVDGKGKLQSDRLLVNLMPRARYKAWLRSLERSCGLDEAAPKHPRPLIFTGDFGWQSTDFWDALMVDVRQSIPKLSTTTVKPHLRLECAAIPITPAEASIMFTPELYRTASEILRVRNSVPTPLDLERMLIGLKGMAKSFRRSTAHDDTVSTSSLDTLRQFLNKGRAITEKDLEIWRAFLRPDSPCPNYSWLEASEKLALRSAGGSSIVDLSRPCGGVPNGLCAKSQTRSTSPSTEEEAQDDIAGRLAPEVETAYYNLFADTKV